jgi:hypothetical protein
MSKMAIFANETRQLQVISAIELKHKLEKYIFENPDALVATGHNYLAVYEGKPDEDNNHQFIGMLSWE